MKKIGLIILGGALIMSSTSCVTKKKFLLAENGRIEALSRGDKLQGQLNECHNEMDKMRGQIDRLQQDTNRQGNSIRHYQQLLSSNMNEQEKLNALLGEKLKELDEREKTIQELQGMIDQQNATVQSLLNSVKDALLGFSSDELTVREQNGKVYVAMSDKLLFQSGSAKLDKRGEEALGKLAEVLNKQTEIDVCIEGHTDNKPIHTAQFKDNWDLSVIRATSVARILIEKYKVNPLQIQPSGRGEYMPVADNETAERSRQEPPHRDYHVAETGQAVPDAEKIRKTESLYKPIALTCFITREVCQGYLLSVYKKILFIDIEATLHRFGRLYLSLQSILPGHDRHFNRKMAPWRNWGKLQRIVLRDAGRTFLHVVIYG